MAYYAFYVKSGTMPGGGEIGSFAFEKRNWSGFFTIFKGLWTGLIYSHSKSFGELKNVIEQAQLGVPHSRISVELGFILQAETY